MKRVVLLLLFIFSIFSITYSAEQLPVLRVYFPGNALIYEDYTRGTMILEDTDGSVTELPAKFKTRGATARLYSMKPSFNMKLETEEGEEIDYNLLGIRKASSFILDAMAIDRICMRNRVCFDIWNSYSRLPYATDFDSRNGTSGRFVIVYMNDNYKGIYCLTDKINRKLLGLKKPKVDSDGDVTIRGVLYKQGTNDIAEQEIPGFYNDYMVYVALWHDAWELKEPDDYPGPAAWAPLVDFYDNLFNKEYVVGKFYEDNLIDYSLLVMALCITDNWGNKNKYFSMLNSQESGDASRFIVTPWDMDTSLGGHYNGDYYDGNYSQWTMQQISSSASIPFSLCFSQNEWWERMRQRWIELRETVFSAENVAGIMYGYCDLFEESGAWEEQVEFWDFYPGPKPKYVTDLRGEIDHIVEWYAKRLLQMDEYFHVDEASVELQHVNGEAGVIYDLNGRRVEPDATVKGTVYIRDGKKWIAR